MVFLDRNLGMIFADMAYASDNVMQMWSHLVLSNQILSLRCPTCEVLIQLMLVCYITVYTSCLQLSIIVIKVLSCYCVAAMVWLYVVRKFFNWHMKLKNNVMCIMNHAYLKPTAWHVCIRCHDLNTLIRDILTCNHLLTYYLFFMF